MSGLKVLGKLEEHRFQILVQLLVGLALNVLRRFGFPLPSVCTPNIDLDETLEEALIRTLQFQEDRLLFLEYIFSGQREPLQVLCTKIVREYMWIAKYRPTKDVLANPGFKETFKISTNQTRVSVAFAALNSDAIRESSEIQTKLGVDSLFGHMPNFSLFRRVMLAHIRRYRMYLLRAIYSPKWTEELNVWFRRAIESGVETAEMKYETVVRESGLQL
jgi:hypothetical protein